MINLNHPDLSATEKTLAPAMQRHRFEEADKILLL